MDEHILIPLPNFNFADIIRRKVHKDIFHFENSYFARLALNGSRDGKGNINRRLKASIKELSDKKEKLIYISEVLLRLAEIQEAFSGRKSPFPEASPLFEYPNTKTRELINETQYFLYKELESCGYDIDTNTFTTEEVVDLTVKINAIINTLEELKGGQNIIFERIDELQQDFKEILNSTLQGKKSTLQRIAGIMVSYVGEKGADEVLELIKPNLKDLIGNGVKLLIG